ncbi:hypothetical protein TTHERM_00625950 (macronuclear) [Tetrahymena thermophila SB210]|uniref:Dynein regulatory complex protein 9 n=1 Tax=Tetrahymena thermophila (strain SB210) TaxID=312017 RepID=Q23S05_TETTS|nr:hypothetical protein TTHERM_00625950 [Tetrahymena thermophila SB210]EAR99234.1 hypothetical protein TTHERM_00625950 [Tetrahymena thermophila SB210]8TH8_J Chain J, Dynein regulatory complex protein 9 [Tetrahymena thermophila]8TID_J Chain J, Dynein regulatory complex protein 9 [Tetrahymena thermophila]|eukprot:XP_001019479.1 hypothetical protein TTHERM_00625950 [Tetrahymena thermophila SB210]
MNQIDAHKLTIILRDATERLTFLDTINRQDDLSSELAGYEISKLLKKQKNLENQYADLVQLRTSLTGIQNKKNLIETQTKIVDVAQNLKESTKKLCRLFKENPDLESDALKVKKDRIQFMAVIEQLIQMVQNNSLTKFQSMTTLELEDQDRLRKLIFREKELYQEIKKLQFDRNQENKEYDNEQKDTNLKIQNLKERLLYKKARAQLKNQYKEKEARAEEGTQQRMYEFEQKQLKEKINNLKQKTDTENMVHEQLRNFLIEKEDQIKQKSDEWAKKVETCREQLQEEIDRLTVEKEKKQEELRELRERDQKEQEEKDRRERQELEEADRKQQEELDQIRLDNAIKLIQIEYQEWKDAGGGKKKRKKGKKKKK